jgi:predicted nucleic acid-binding protein
MIAYLDSSVVLRLVLGEKGRLAEFGRITRGVSSLLLKVECLRTIDRLRLAGRIPADEVVPRLEAIHRFLEAVDLVEPGRDVLERAAQSFPIALGTLDAVHLATALLWREQEEQPLVMATHDATLAMAARASAFTVIGV